MANVASKDILLSVNVGTESAPEWKKVGCSTADGFSGTTETVAIATKCNGGFVDNQPGDKSWSFDNTSYVDKDNASDFVTHDELFEMWINDEVNQWKLESIDAEYDYLRIGNGFITDLGDTSDQGDYLQFSITITGSGEISNVETT